MDEEQRYMRYVIPGFVAPVAFLISVWIAHPGAVLRIAGYALSSPTAGLLSALVALLASGSLGFLLAQIYFACPFSVPDYRPFFQSNPAPRVPNECSELLGRIREGGICPLQRLRARRNAQVLARYTWQVNVAPNAKKLNNHIRDQASRKASIGAAALGLLLALFLWLWAIFATLDCTKVVWWRALVAAVVVYAGPLLCIWQAHLQIVRFLEFSVPAGIKRHP